MSRISVLLAVGVGDARAHKDAARITKKARVCMTVTNEGVRQELLVSAVEAVGTTL